MSKFVRTNNWANGANNRAKPGRLPEGFVRELINIDARPTGELVLRPGAERVYAGSDVRWACAVGDEVIIIDGAQILAMDAETGVARTVGNIQPAGAVAGCVHNGEAFFCTDAEGFRYDGTLRPWGVPVPAYTVTTPAGALPAGVYKVAVTVLDASGAESGADVVTLSVDGTQDIRVAGPEGAAVYISAVNGKSLYFQGRIAGSSYLAASVVDAEQRLETGACVPMPRGHAVASHNGQLLVARGNEVWMSLPFNPALTDRSYGYVAFPARVENMMSGSGGLYVTADAAYRVTGVGTQTPSVSTVSDVPGVANTAVKLDDGTVAWFTRYGLARANGDTVEFPNRMSYAPVEADVGAAGVVEHDGGSTVITTLGAGVRQNAAATADFCDLEVVKK